MRLLDGSLRGSQLARALTTLIFTKPDVNSMLVGFGDDLCHVSEHASTVGSRALTTLPPRPVQPNKCQERMRRQIEQPQECGMQQKKTNALPNRDQRSLHNQSLAGVGGRDVSTRARDFFQCLLKDWGRR